MKIFNLNKDAWDHAVDVGDNPYTDAVSPEEIVKAKQGDWSVYPMWNMKHLARKY